MRIVVGKIGLDGHDVGVRLLARRLRDEGAEVIYLGKRNTPEDFVVAIEQEDADAVGIGSLTGGLAELTAELVEELRVRGLEHVRVVAGGIVEAPDEVAMAEIGVRFFGPDAPLADVVDSLMGRGEG